MITIRTKLKRGFSLIDMTPLVDVIFLLLIFFFITSDILPLKSLNIENPTLDLASPPITSQLLIVMDAQHVIYLGSKKAIIDMPSVKESLEGEIARIEREHPGAKPTAVLSIDKRVDYESFLKLFALVQSCCPRIRLIYHEASA